MTANHAQVPVLLMVDVEPSGFFVPRDRPDPWLGFERGVEIMAELRRSLEQRTGQAAHFTWLVRADPQIAEVYGDAAWGLEHYRSQLDALDAAGDEIGLHVHAYRWNANAGNWIEDYGDQAWVEHCVRLGFAAFESTRRCRPAAFSMGTDWSNQATMDLARELGVRWELSLIAGDAPRPLRFLTGRYTGDAPDCTDLPHLPYMAARDDFRRQAAVPDDGVWIIPLSSYVAPLELSWKRRLYYRMRLQPIEWRTRKFFLTDSPASLRPAIDEALKSARPYVTLSVRTEKFLRRRAIAAMRDNLDHLVARAGADLVFAAPGEALRILDATAAQRSTVASAWQPVERQAP